LFIETRYYNKDIILFFVQIIRSSCSKIIVELSNKIIYSKLTSNAFCSKLINNVLCNRFINDAFCNRLINNSLRRKLVKRFNLYNVILLFEDCFVVSLSQFK